MLTSLNKNILMDNSQNIIRNKWLAGGCSCGFNLKKDFISNKVIQILIQLFYLNIIGFLILKRHYEVD